MLLTNWRMTLPDWVTISLFLTPTRHSCREASLSNVNTHIWYIKTNEIYSCIKKEVWQCWTHGKRVSISTSPSTVYAKEKMSVNCQNGKGVRILW